MVWTTVSHLIVLLHIFGISQAFFETCDETINIAAAETKYVRSDGYFLGIGYTPGSSCRYTIIAPVEYQVRATCIINLPDPSYGSCSSERFYFAVDGRKNFTTSNYFCGLNTVALTSTGNQMVLAYASNSYSGIFLCTLTTVCDCGWSVTSRIVGGTSASVNEFTPMAAIIDVTTSQVYCGGTIVSSKYVLTAAHCLRVTTVSNTKVSLGDHDVSSVTDTPAVVFFAQTFIEHSGYSTVTNNNDIGLIELQETISWSRAVSPACLPFFYTLNTFTGTKVIATGWGTTSFGGPSSNILQKVNLDVIDNAVCESTYPNISPSQMCTLTPQKDTCQYDSGGPLFYRGLSDPRLFLLGLVSFGQGCDGSSPALNTRMTAHLSWIESYTDTLCRRAFA